MPAPDFLSEHIKLTNMMRAAGATFGALAIKESVPDQYKHMVMGPSLKVGLHNVVISARVLTLTFGIAFAQ
ncbi:hypothetical protein AgCh_013743 [Apium graveolens]